MSYTFVPVGVAFAAVIVVPIVVKAIARRSDQRNGVLKDPKYGRAGALLTVRNRSFQWWLFRILGGGLALLGLVLVISGLATGSEQGFAPGFFGVVLLIAGGGGLRFASWLRRTRVVVMPDHLLVTQGFRAERRVELSDIAAVMPWTGNYGGLQAKDAAGKRLFTASGIMRGYTELEQFLGERVGAPSSLAASTTVEVVAPWSGGAVSAEYVQWRRGPRASERPAVRFSASGAKTVIPLGELQELVRHRVVAAESVEPPVAFLCWPGTAAPGSIVGDATAGLPEESLALLIDPMERPTAVMHEADVATFTAWIEGLPEKLPTTASPAGR